MALDDAVAGDGYGRRVSFSFHTDVADHPMFGTLSTAAFGLWVLAGQWTSGHHSPGFVPDHAAADLADNPDTVGTPRRRSLDPGRGRLPDGIRLASSTHAPLLPPLRLDLLVHEAEPLADGRADPGAARDHRPAGRIRLRPWSRKRRPPCHTRLGLASASRRRPPPVGDAVAAG